MQYVHLQVCKILLLHFKINIAIIVQRNGIFREMKLLKSWLHQSGLHRNSNLYFACNMQVR